MPRFAYTARDGSGHDRDGVLEALSRREALRTLSARGLRPLGVLEEGGDVRAATSAGITGRWSRSDRLPFLEALSRLVAGGMSAGEAVRLLAARLHEARQRRLAAALWERLSEGRTLSQALADFPHVFDNQTVNLVAAGEATGNLREVLTRLIVHFTEQRDLRRKFLAAITYPALICGVGFGVVLFFLFFLLPRLQVLLAALGGRLPPSTQLLVSASHFFMNYGPFLVTGAVLAFVALWRWRRTPSGRAATDAWLLKAPFAGAFALRSAILNFSHTLAILLENGITTAEALRMAERTVENTALRRLLREATDRVMEGESLSRALARTGVFPPLVLDRLAVGEQTGGLAPGLRAIATDYREELARWLHAFTQFVSTGTLLVTFSFVAFLSYAIVSAILEVSGSFVF